MRRSQAAVWMVILGLVFLALTAGVQAQEAGCGHHEEDSAKVMSMERPRFPGLKEFHDIMRPVWHDFIPEKNYKAIREAVPEFQKNLEIVMKAEIPQYFHAKKEELEKKRLAMAEAVAALDVAAKGTDDGALEVAVENVHTSFEQMARTLAPRMREIDRFHLVLYPLWHEALPKSDWASIKATAPLMRAKMDTLMAAAVPEWAKEIEAKVIEERAGLDKAVTVFVETCQANKDAEIKDKLTLLHEHFMALDGVFE